MNRRATAIGPALLAASLLAAAPAHAWGFLAHRLVNAKATTTLPEPLRQLFAGNVGYLREHAVDPDLWRGAGLAHEDPNHFLDLDAFGTFPFDIPAGEAEHLARHGAEAVRSGRVPWRVGEEYRALVGAFRSKDSAEVLRHAAVLGHYLGDAHVPLHAVLNYDGQLTGQDGFHSRWEKDLVERFERQLEPRLANAAATRIADPVALTFSVLRESYLEAQPALAADLESRGARDLIETTSDERYGDAYYSRLYEREGERLVARLGAAAQAIGNAWYSAWDEAGRPELDWNFRWPYVRGEARAIVLTLDGASAPVIDDAVRRGVMPNLARLRAAGATARGSLAPLPVKTAPGHAAFFTGAWSDVNGITGNSVPRPGGTILEWDSGYASRDLVAEPIWVTAARQGLDATVVAGTQTYPFAPYFEERRFGGSYKWNLTLFDGYQGIQGPDRVLTLGDLKAESTPAKVPEHAGDVRAFSVAIAGTRVDVVMFDDPTDPATGLDTLELRSGASVTRVKPLPLASDANAFGVLRLALPAGDVGVFLRLFTLAPDGTEMRLYHTSPSVLRSSRAGLATAVLDATQGFVPGVASLLYSQGVLGPPLWAGGDGNAEERYLETVALLVRQFQRLVELGLDRMAGKLLITYLPVPDEFSHNWLGYLDPALPGHDRALAARLRPYFDRGLRLADEHVGFLMSKAGPDTVVVVGADHGQVAVNRLLRPNVALRAAGLLTLDAEGKVDLARTRAMYFLGNVGYVLVNRVGRPGGIVTKEQEPDVRRAVAAALRAVRDPETHELLVRELLDAHAGPGPYGIGGPNGGDLYLSLAPGTHLESATSGPLVERTAPAGEHVVDPQRLEMQATFQLAGAGVAAGVDLGSIRQIDVAATLCALLGLDPPAQSTGAVLTRALSRAPRAVAAKSGRGPH